MLKVVLKGLAGRKLRAALTAFAIVLGVAMISGTYVLTDTINAGFTQVFTSVYKQTDAIITGKSVVGNGGNGGNNAPSFDESLLRKVQALPDVADASGGIADQAQLVGHDGKVITAGGAPGLAFSVSPGHRFNPLELTAGRWPHGPDEIAIDAHTASAKDFAVGDRIQVIARGPEQQFRIVGIDKLGGVSSIGGATIAVFDLRTAQKLFDKEGRLDSISIAAKPNVSTSQLVSAVRQIVPPATQVRSGQQEAKQAVKDTSDFTKIFRYFLLAFAGIALFVGTFVIANTLSITIAQRAREFGTLRTLGATRRQLLRSVLLEGSVIGLLASLVGLGLGVGLAKALDALFKAGGIDLPQAGLVFATRTVVVSLIVGTLVTLIASLMPAIRATRVEPIAAVREGVLPPSRLERFGVPVAGVVLAISLALLFFGALDGSAATSVRLLSIGVGVVAAFVGIALLAPTMVPSLVRGVAHPPVYAAALGLCGVALVALTAAELGGASFGDVASVIIGVVDVAGAAVVLTRLFDTASARSVSGALARDNAMRNPARTASTAAALMIGLALVTLVAVVAAGLKTRFESSVDALFHADYALTSENGFTPTGVASEQAVRRVPGVQVVAGVRAGDGKAFGHRIGVTGVPGDISKVIEVDWTKGSPAVPGQLGSDGAFVSKGYAKDHRLTLGSPVPVTLPDGETLPLKVKGVFDPPKGGSPYGDVTISSTLFDRVFQHPQNVYAFVDIAGGVTKANTDALNRALKLFPDAKVQTESQFKHQQEQGINLLLNLLYVLLSLAIVVSLFGIVNTLVLTVFERTRELGMLRAVGMTRRQVRAMIRKEAILTALVGAVLGIPLGIGLAALLGHAIGYPAFTIPWRSLLVFVNAAIFVGLLAAIFPARRAARLNVLQALQYE
jgi:ABC-type antimicrobial peptide transport system permease subunit